MYWPEDEDKKMLGIQETWGQHGQPPAVEESLVRDAAQLQANRRTAGRCRIRHVRWIHPGSSTFLCGFDQAARFSAF